jgi:hypothetical protein
LRHSVSKRVDIVGTLHQLREGVLSLTLLSIQDYLQRPTNSLLALREEMIVLVKSEVENSFAGIFNLDPIEYPLA